MEFEKKLILEKIEMIKKEGYYPLKKQDELINKSLQKSVEARTLGNQLFRKQDHDEKIHEEIWKLYSESIAFAPNNSEELACGYANRSAFLIHLCKYKECLLDIERALKITQSSALKVKLFCRQAKCFVALQDGKQNSSLKKANHWLNKVESSQEAEKLQKTLQSAVKVIEEDILDTLEEERKPDILAKHNLVDIRYNEKYGRYLVATRDIKPGEFVCVEKFYATSINKTKRYAYCSNCLGISWATIPCNNCAYYMYCSEDCKNEAWKKYHHIECYARFLKNADINRDHVEISIRLFIMGMKEAGNFENLKKLVYEVESSSDNKIKWFSVDGKFSSNSFRCLMSLCYTNDDGKIRKLAFVAILAAMVLTKNSKVFVNVFQFTTGDNYEHMQHKDFIFIASLLLRLLSICLMNDFFVTHINRGCLVAKSPGQCVHNCCLRGVGLSLVTSLINHSCDSNVDKFCTNDGKIVYYAVKPIKENSQIFSSYRYDYFTAPSKAVRQSFFDDYDFICDCLPCQQDWPNSKILVDKIGKETLPLSCHIMMQKYQELLSRNSFDVDIQYSNKFIHSFTKFIAKLYENTTSPSAIFESFCTYLNMMIENRYCSILKIPDTCKSMKNLQ